MFSLVTLDVDIYLSFIYFRSKVLLTSGLWVPDIRKNPKQNPRYPDWLLKKKKKDKSCRSF